MDFSFWYVDMYHYVLTGLQTRGMLSDHLQRFSRSMPRRSQPPRTSRIAIPITLTIGSCA